MHDAVPARRPERRLRARHVGLEGLGPGTTDAAIETADYVDRPPPRAGGRPRRRLRPRGEAPRVLAAGSPSGPSAGRSPTSTDALYVDRQFAEADDPDAAVKRVVLLVLKSPRFLYREIGGEHARRLRRRLAAVVRALGLARPTRSCSTPRRPGQARDPRAGRRAGRADGRRPADPREAPRVLPPVAARSIRSPTSPRTRSCSPSFDAAIASDLRTSLDLFLDDVVWSESSDFRQLLLADELYLNGRLAKILRRRPAGRRAVPEGRARAERAGRGADASVPAGDASPTRRRARRSTAACSCRGACWAARSGRRPRPSPRSPPTCTRTSRPASGSSLQTKPAACMTCHGDDQSAGIHPGAIRRRRPISAARRRASRSTRRVATRPATARR